jgi:hypothetical protein
VPHKKQHYVSQFYLKHFASKPHRINILNLKDFKSYEDGPLKAQCYRNHLYGPDDTVEKLLGKFETVAAPIIDSIVQNSTLPNRSSQEYFRFLQFMALQMQRTPVAINRVNQAFEKTRANLTSSYGGVSPQLGAQLTLQPYEAARIALSNFAYVQQFFAGLSCKLLVNTTAHSFVTSDKPAFKYNLYCEPVRDTGILGVSQSGFMLFIPLSPRHLVVFYDGEAYKCSPTHQTVTIVNLPDDVQQLNKMQVINADCNLLFSNWAERDDITKLAHNAAVLRKQKEVVVRELIPADGRDGNGILHQFERTAMLRLKLSLFQYSQRGQACPTG